MSARRRSRKRRHSSQPSSPISSAAAPIARFEQKEDSVVRFAESDDDVIAIHRFLLVVAQSAMVGKVDATKSATEVWRVAKDEAAIMLIHDGQLIGTMGVIAVDWWYSHDRFMTDRWHFVLPDYINTPHAAKLEEEARALANQAGLPFIHQGKLRHRSNGEARMTPRLDRGESATSVNGG